jgi:hypothetical protein
MECLTGSITRRSWSTTARADAPGTSGRARQRWADRRAWTWEVHVRGELAWESVAALHVPPDLYDEALEAAIAWPSTYGGSVPVVMRVPDGLPAGYEGIYLDSGRVLRDLVGGP